MRIEICLLLFFKLADIVTPHAGVRIEIVTPVTVEPVAAVTPHAGVRIEITQGTDL